MTEGLKGWVFYDAECPFCRGWADRAYGTLSRHGFHLAPLQSPWARLRLGMKEGAPLTEMRMLTASGDTFGGADVVVEISRSIWWAWPFYLFAQVPGIKLTMRAVYRHIAANRHCLVRFNHDTAKRREKSHHRAASFYELP